MDNKDNNTYCWSQNYAVKHVWKIYLKIIGHVLPIVPNGHAPGFLNGTNAYEDQLSMSADSLKSPGYVQRPEATVKVLSGIKYSLSQQASREHAKCPSIMVGKNGEMYRYSQGYAHWFAHERA